MMKLKYFWFVSLLSLIGCGNVVLKDDKNFNELEITDYEKFLNIDDFFGDSLVSHFPNDSIIVGVQDIDTFGYHNTFSWFLTEDNSKNKIDSILKLSNYYKSDDSSLLVVNELFNGD